MRREMWELAGTKFVRHNRESQKRINRVIFGIIPRMAQIKRILVTGAAGFLGSHICERLVEQSHDVICLDNFFTSQKTNVSHLLERSNFELIRHDVTEPIVLEVDEIYNFACPAAPGHYQYNP